MIESRQDAVRDQGVVFLGPHRGKRIKCTAPVRGETKPAVEAPPDRAVVAAAVVALACWLGTRNPLVPAVSAIYCLGSLIVYLQMVRGMRSRRDAVSPLLAEGTAIVS